MPRIVYHGKHTAVEVPHLGIAYASFGEPVDVSDQAAELLLGQPRNWALESSDAGRAAVAEAAARVRRRAAAERRAAAARAEQERADKAPGEPGEPAAPAGQGG